MSTRATIRGRIRDELNDNGAVKLWSDALLNGWIGDAIVDWSRLAGRERTYTTTSTANVGSYALPTDTLEVLRVEHPAGYFRERVPFRDGDVSASVLVTSDLTLGPAGLLYDVWGGSLVLSPAPDRSGQAIAVRYLAQYTVVSDDVTALDVPIAEDLCLVLYGCARALLWIGTDEAKRQRFERDRGADPTALLRGEYARRYQEQAERRRSGVRQRRLIVR